MKKKLRDVVRELRKNSTDAERLLWNNLRMKQLAGYKFRRQCPIGPYVVDFASLKKRVVIEIDGGQHALKETYDKERDNWLHKQGFEVLRFWNTEVLLNMDGVLEVVRRKLVTPSHQGRGGVARLGSNGKGIMDRRIECPTYTFLTVSCRSGIG